MRFGKALVERGDKDSRSGDMENLSGVLAGHVKTASFPVVSVAFARWG